MQRCEHVPKRFSFPPNAELAIRPSPPILMRWPWPVERNRAADIIARLQEEFVHYAVLEPFFWEDQPALATATFQSQFPEASGMDIGIGILWARIDTPLPLGACPRIRP